MRRVVLALLAAFATACAQVHGVLDAGAAAVDAANVADAAGGADVGAPPLDASGPTRSGFVELLRERDDVRPGGVTLSAYFDSVSPAISDRWLFASGCVVIDREGPCRAITCNGTPSSESAGNITGRWRDRTIDTYLLPEVAELAGAVIDEYIGTGPLDVEAGELIGVTATGDVVPAFTATVTEPDPVEATLPTRVSRSTDLVVTWTPSAAAEMDVFLTPMPIDSPIVVCTVPASAGAVTLPGRLVAGTSDRSTTAWLTLQSIETTTVVAGDYQIDVYAADMWGVENVVTIDP